MGWGHFKSVLQHASWVTPHHLHVDAWWRLNRRDHERPVVTMGNSHSISAQSAFDCAQKGDSRSLQTLLQEVQQRRGTDLRSYVEFRDPRGLTPLMAAAAGGNVETIKLVISITPVLRARHLAVAHHPAIRPPLQLNVVVDVQLLRYGASVHAVSSPPESTTALHLAANGHLAAVDALVNAGANPFVENGRRERLPACQGCDMSAKPVCRQPSRLG